MKKAIIIGSAVLLSGCIVEPPRTYYSPQQPYYPETGQYQQQQYPQQYQQQYDPQQYQQQSPDDYQEPAQQPVVSVYVDPPLVQPAPVLVAWAPPPMLVESPPPMPYEGAIWTGGYWVWEGNWVWAYGRWAYAPRPGYSWVNPYYENRNGSVVFVNGFWAAPGVTFVPPPRGISISIGIVSAGVIAGPRCRGPEGVFVPPPPGSHHGLIVPAPIGTSPAVVTGAPPIVNQGMHITAVNGQGNYGRGNRVNIVAPSGSTANGQAVNTAVPVQPHLAASMPPVVHAYAPDPISSRPIPAYIAGHQPAALPGPQSVHIDAGPQPHSYGQQPAPYPQPGGRQINAPENRVQPTESKPQPYEQRQPQYEQKPQQYDQRQPQYEQKPQQYDQRQQQYEQKPQQYEPRQPQNTQQIEQRPAQHEQRPQQYEPRPLTVPQQIPQPVEQKPQQVQQNKEKKEGSEKKLEHDRNQ